MKIKLSLFFHELVAMVCIGDALQLPKLLVGVLGGEKKNKLMEALRANNGTPITDKVDGGENALRKGDKMRCQLRQLTR